MRKFRRLASRIGYTALPALAIVGPAFAQKAPDTSAATGNDIVVTARRSEERLQDVPISITVLTQDAIAKRNISNAGDLANYVPSLSSNSSFGPEKSNFAIRGFTQESTTSPSVGVYFADVIAPRSTATTNGGNGAGPGSLFDLQNIQVLKGPQGTLFGRNTTGGAILLVPAKPSTEFLGSVEVSLGNYDMRRLQAMLNVPINDTFRVRGALDWNQRAGYTNNLSGIGPKHFDDMHYIAGRLSVVAQLTPDLENYTIASFSSSHNNGSVPNLLACNDGSHPGVAPPTGLAALLYPLACAQIARDKGSPYNVENTDTDPYERVKQWQVINTTTWIASDAITVKNIISYAEYREASSFNLWGDNLIAPAGSVYPPPGPVPVLELHPAPSGYSSAQSTFTEEFQVHGRSGDERLNYQAGLYLELSRPLAYRGTQASIFLSCTDISTFQCTNPLGFGSIDEYSLKDVYNNKGVYAQVDYRITDKLTATGGFRYTLDKQENSGEQISVLVPTPGAPVYTCQNILYFNDGTPQAPVPVVVGGYTTGACLLKFVTKSQKPTWLINADYKFGNNVMAYAKWARGYRQGSINQNNLGFPTWGPEKVDTYEIGAKTSFHGRVPGYFNFAAFYNDFRNQQLAASTVIAPAYQGAVPPQELILNAGKSRIWGLEVDSSVKPFSGLQLDAAYAYLNTKLISFTTPALPVYYSALETEAEIGGPLALAPKNRVTLTGTYTLPLDASVGEVSFGATFTHTDSQRGRSPATSPVLGTIPASNLLNLNVDWRSAFGRPLDLSFFMTNVTNENHILFPDGSWETYGAEGGHPELPRMFGFRAKVRFGS